MKNKTRYIVIAIIIIGLVIFYFKHNNTTNIYTFKDGKMSYSEERGNPVYDINLVSENNTFNLYKVNYESRNFLKYNTTIHGLLFIPKKDGKEMENTKAIVLLPGGGQTKEGASSLAEKIVELGYSVFVIDQRGIGETGGYYLSLEDDYSVSAQGKEPIQHLSVYDALRAFDVLRKIKNVDKEEVGMMGASMGGRYAMIATAIDKNIKGVVIISSSGFNFLNQPDKLYNNYLLSIDADRYVSDISPRLLFMFQSKNDSVVKLEDARRTFDNAGNQKEFYTVENCAHGYCSGMYENMSIALNELFKN